jgi:spoIIIJ-associated protein
MTENGPITAVEMPEFEERRQATVGMLQQILELGGLEGAAHVRDDVRDGIEAVIDGPDAALLIGKHGQTLNSLQHVLSLMLKHRFGEHIRVSIDAENYRARRAESLTQMARELASKVKAAGQEAVMDPLNALERRIVHTALLEEPGIMTYSEGEEPQRRVVISPKPE